MEVLAVTATRIWVATGQREIDCLAVDAAMAHDVISDAGWTAGLQAGRMRHVTLPATGPSLAPVVEEAGSSHALKISSCWDCSLSVTTLLMCVDLPVPTTCLLIGFSALQQEKMYMHSSVYEKNDVLDKVRIKH